MIDVCKSQEKEEDTFSKLLMNLKKEFGKDSKTVAKLHKIKGNENKKLKKFEYGLYHLQQALNIYKKLAKKDDEDDYTDYEEYVADTLREIAELYKD